MKMILPEIGNMSNWQTEQAQTYFPFRAHDDASGFLAH